jgi:hypothetical protein
LKSDLPNAFSSCSLGLKSFQVYYHWTTSFPLSYTTFLLLGVHTRSCICPTIFHPLVGICCEVTSSLTPLMRTVTWTDHTVMCVGLFLVLLLKTCKLLKCMSQKLHHITYQHKFSFHSCGSYVLGNTIKLSASMYPTCVTNPPPTRSL